MDDADYRAESERSEMAIEELEDKIESLTAEVKRLKWENELLTEAKRRDGGLRDSENAFEHSVRGRESGVSADSRQKDVRARHATTGSSLADGGGTPIAMPNDAVENKIYRDALITIRDRCYETDYPAANIADRALTNAPIAGLPDTDEEGRK